MIEEYRTEKITSFTTGLQAREIQECRSKSLVKSSARIFSEGKIYSSNKLGETQKEWLKEAALKNDLGALNAPYAYDAKESKSFDDSREMTDEEVIQFTERVKDLFHEKLPNFLISGKVEWEQKELYLENNQGGKLDHRYGAGKGFIVLKRKGSPNIMDSAVGLDFNDTTILERLDPFIEFHRAFDREVTLKDGEYPVVFVGEDNMSFISKFTESLDPDRYFQRAAYYSGELNEQIFHPNLNLDDCRHLKELTQPRYFSDEAELLDDKVEIIKNGVFNNLLSDKMSAQRYDIKSTGNGRREYNSAVSPRPYHLRFNSTGQGHQDLFRQFPQVIVAFISAGGDTSSNGDFSTPVQLGFFVEEGKIKGRLSQVTLNQNVDKIMGEKFISIPEDSLLPAFERSFVARMNTYS